MQENTSTGSEMRRAGSAVRSASPINPDTQILHHYYSYAYVHYCKKNNFFSSLSETIKHLLCPQVFWGGDPFAAVGMSVQCENAPTALSFEWFSYM